MSGKARVLAVDDQAYFRTHLEEILREAGYGVVTAESGREALRCLEREGPFDLVLTDLVMPEMDGIETVEKVREEWPDLPIIVITAVGDVRSAVAAIRRGASDYLLKPLDRDGLLTSIDSVLQQRRLRTEHARLVSENIEFMGRLSLYERATDLFALSGTGPIAQKLLELFCVEARASAGVVWVRGADGQLSRAALREQPGAPEVLPDADVPSDGLQAGPVLRPHPASPELLELWVGSYREGVLTAAACLLASNAAPPGPGELAACARLGELGALALERQGRSPESTAGQSQGAQGARRPGADVRDPETDLASLSFLSEVARIELHKAQRFGRSFALLCLEVGDSAVPASQQVPVLDIVRGCLRSTDILAAEPGGTFWMLLAESEPLGGIVLKRRIADRVAKLGLLHEGQPLEIFTGLSSFPQDGTTVDGLLDVARTRATDDRRSVVRNLGLDACENFEELTRRLLDSGTAQPAPLVSAAADLVIGDLASRPGDRGLLFLAPGTERSAFIAPLVALGQVETATEVFVAVDGDTLPDGPSLHALALSPRLGDETSWIVRFGEAPPYALIAGPPGDDGRRKVFHASDPALVEHLAFQLRTEVGFGVRA